MPDQTQRHSSIRPRAWNFYSAGRLTFGPGSIRELPGALNLLNARRVTLIADPALQAAGVLERVLKSMDGLPIEIDPFLEGEPEPSIATAESAAAKAREFEPDLIIGLGGGSAMDLAKFVSALVARRRPAHEFFGFHNVPGPIRPIIAIPTTAGTGSEVSHAAVLTDTEREIKVSALSPFFRPTVAIVDPELTHSLPRQPTADSGIDALVHAVEAYTATDFAEMPIDPTQLAAYDGRTPIADIFAKEAIQLIGKSLVSAVENPTDFEARNNMALAATYAGLAFSNAGVALVHALEYPIGGALHCSHGGGNGMFLPFVLRYLADSRAQRIAEVGRLLGAVGAHTPLDEAVDQTIHWIENLKRRIGIPMRIRDLNGSRDRLPEFARKTFEIKRLMETTPKDVTETDVLQILEDAF